MADFRGPRIAMVGVGKVGAAATYSIIHKQIASEVLIYDINADYLDAQVQDLRDSTSFGISPRVRAATLKECGQCDVIVFTAGTNQKPGESRLALVQRNIGVIRDGFEQMKPFKEDAIIIVVTNPVDVMTYFAVQYSGLPANQVFGSGTVLDTTRLKDTIAQRAEVAPRDVHAYIVGEHGDSQTIAWSNMAIGGIPVDQVMPLNDEERSEIAEFIRFKADRLNKVKGETSWGVGACISNICTSVLLDERHILPISHISEEKGISYNRPALVGRRGIIRSFDLILNETEQASLDKSIAKLQGVVRTTENPDEAATAPSS